MNIKTTIQTIHGQRLPEIFDEDHEVNKFDEEHLNSFLFIKQKYITITYSVEILTQKLTRIVNKHGGGMGFRCPPPHPNTSWHVFPSVDTGNVDQVWWILDLPQTQEPIIELRKLFKRRLSLLKIRDKWYNRALHAKDGANPYFWQDQYDETEKST